MTKNIIISLNIIFFFIIYLHLNYIYSNNITKELVLSSYIKGIHLADAKGTITVNNDKFNITINARTIGLFSIISNWEQSISSKGILSNLTLISENYISNDSRGKKKGHMYINFQKKYPTIISAQPDPRKDDRREKIKKEKLINTLDPIFGILNIGVKGNCRSSIMIFDGKRKYMINSKNLGLETIKENYFYTKPFKAVKCSFEIEKIAGYTEKELKKYPKGGNIWFRKEAQTSLFFPSKIEITSTWGKFLCLIKKKELNNESNNM